MNEKDENIGRALILCGGGARGAFQVGVLKYLDEKGWRPDMICGASVGAVNAVGIGAGMTPDQIADLWKRFNRRQIYRFALGGHLRSLSKRGAYQSVMNTAPLKALLRNHLAIDQLPESTIDILINAVHPPTSRLLYFEKDQIRLAHVLAASALPFFFPWQYIDGEPYWDGGMIENTPIAPALKRGAKEIIVVLLTPVGNDTLPMPRTPLQVGEFVLEQLLQGTYQSLLINQGFQFKKVQADGFQHGYHTLKDLSCRVAAVSPAQMLGFNSFLNFSSAQAIHLIEHGYFQARRQLQRFI